jgi:hypothetical protein
MNDSYPKHRNAHHYSGNLYHGTTNGNPATTTGFIHQAFNFDGTDDFISIPWDYPVSGDNQSFSFAAWV